jgi:glycine dehydrogenase subunit 1
MGAMHMALLGPDGLRDLAHRNLAACQCAKEILASTKGIELVHAAHHFNEFSIRVPGSAKDCLAYLDENGIIGGFDLTTWYPQYNDQILVTATDQTSLRDIEALSAQLAMWSMHQGVSA